MAERDTWRNWARNQRCTPAAWETPRSDLEVVEAVRRARSAGQAVKVVGNGHSFTDVACTDGRLLSLDLLDRVLAVDTEAGTVTVEAGITIRQLNRELAERGLGLTNLGDIDRQTISGAISTGTHGTGARLGGLATFIRAMELVTADGDVVRCSPDEEPEVFHGARVGLGALGVVTKLTLACEPAFTLRHVERAGKLDEVVAEIDQLADGHDHFEFYWLPHTDTCSLLCNDRTDEAPRPKSAYKRWRAEVFFPNYFFGAVVTAGRLHPAWVPRLAGVVGSSVGSTRLIDRSDRILISTRLLRFVEMEYAIPRAHAREAVLAVRDLIDGEGLRVSFPVEVRFTAPDDIPLSTAHGRDTCYIAVHMARGMAYARYFDGVEAIMDRFDGRPHWGKLHGQRAETLAPRYPEWERFGRLRERLDPEGRFANGYLDRVLGPMAPLLSPDGHR
jgi:FAD-linked oxidoreductase